MASSAFKSTSKRGNRNPSTPRYNCDSNSIQKTPLVRKRSSSVNAVSRAKQFLDISTDFSNKRENPLFWTSISSPTDKENDGISATVRRTEKENEREKTGVESTTKKGSHKTAATDHRGRSVTRNSGVKNGIGRSISRDGGRSLSRGHYGACVSRGHCGAFESEKEQEVATGSSSQSSNLKQVIYNVKNDNVIRNGADIWGQFINSQCQATECSEDDSACSFQISNREDGISICSFSETEEKTIKAVSEQMKSFRDDQWGADTSASGIHETVRSEVRRAISDIQNDIESVIRRNNVNAIATTSVTDIPSHSINPGADEFTMDIRREYAQKLGESEERARKLRAELAVEEHRGQEFSRILQEILPDPKTSNPQKSRFGRKRSSERKRISKRLTEEAMAYFDECVSIPTFDSSDFSAPEDPPHCLAGPPNLVGGSVSVTGECSKINLSLDALDSYSTNKQAVLGGDDRHMNSCEDSDFEVNSSSYEPTADQVEQRSNSRGNSKPHQFSFSQKPKENFRSHDIDSYVKHFVGGANRNMVIADVKRSDYDTGEHDLHGRVERLLFDRVFSRNRIECGGLHLCVGNGAVAFSPFGCVI